MERTSIAVLGTLAEFHQKPIPYDLPALVALVERINPDLLCLDISPDQWRSQQFADLPSEYRDALLPLAYQTDMVVAPVGESESQGVEPVFSGWRGLCFRVLRRWLAWLQRTAPGPDGINQGWRHEAGNHLYEMMRRLGGKAAREHYDQRLHDLSQAVEEIALNNPGNRILVVTNIQYCHHIRPHLRRNPTLEVTSYDAL